MYKSGDDEIVLTVFRLQELLMTAMVSHLPVEEKFCLGERLAAVVGDAMAREGLSSEKDRMISAMVGATLMTLGQK